MSDLRFDNRVAIVTGAGNGLGRAHALLLAAHGAKVVVNDLGGGHTGGGKSSAAADKVVEEIKAAGGQAIANYDSVEDGSKIVQSALDAFKRVDIVVNNAAILVPGTIETVQPRHMDLIWQIDLRGPLLLIREALPHLRAAGAGHIINVSSGVAIFPGPGPYPEVQAGGSFYGMVKAGLERVSQGLAMELQGAGIAVNVLSVTRQVRTPGNVWAQNDPEHPNLNFEPAGYLGAVARWICEQPPAKFTGNIVFAEDLFAERGLEASTD